MLSKAENDLLCQVGPGTLMGNLLRRYWTPALLSIEAPEPDSPPLRVRLLGEDLVAFRDSTGTVGMVAQACPHRGASLFFGRNEEEGLRCVYHGWKFDRSGACVDMPSEPAESNFRTKVRVVAYPTHESGGIVWVYMGPPETMTPFRDLGFGALDKDQWHASKVLSTCNWIQGFEGNIDSSHTAFLHLNFSSLAAEADETDRPGVPSPQMSTAARMFDRAPRIEVQDTPYGLRYAGIRATPKGNLHVRLTEVIAPWFCYVASNPFNDNDITMQIPIDDHSHWRMYITTKARSNRAALRASPPPYPDYHLDGFHQREISEQNDYLLDREVQRTFNYTGIYGVPQQDMAMTETMGAIADRSVEHLGTSDGAIIRFRRMLLKAARDLAKGIEPPGVDPAIRYDQVRAAERIIAPGDDWRLLGTEHDPLEQKATPVTG
jgi:phenylpropionate dioxygenase-like ring-hydroxylating dioxygenase large terminal subunit